MRTFPSSIGMVMVAPRTRPWPISTLERHGLYRQRGWKELTPVYPGPYIDRIVIHGYFLDRCEHQKSMRSQNTMMHQPFRNFPLNLAHFKVGKRCERSEMETNLGGQLG